MISPGIDLCLMILEGIGRAAGWLFFQSGLIAACALYLARRHRDMNASRAALELRGGLVALLVCPVLSTAVFLLWAFLLPHDAWGAARGYLAVIPGLAGVVWIVLGIRALMQLREQHREAARLRATATRVDGTLPQHMEQLATLFSVTPTVCLEHPEVESPMLLGSRDAALLIPVGHEHQVNHPGLLIHMLTHVRRGDVAWHVLGELCVALFILQPLVRVVVNTLDEVVEEAVDEVALHHGVKRKIYLCHLMEYGNKYTRELPGAVAGLGLKAFSGTLNRRILRLQDATPPTMAPPGRRDLAYSTGGWSLAALFSALLPYVL